MLFDERDYEPSESICPSGFGGFDVGSVNTQKSDQIREMVRRKKLSSDASTIQSLVIRPEEHKFTNVFNINAMEDVGSIPNISISTVMDILVDDEDMTAEKINKALCKNKDCPGVKKFKEYGLGPLATGRGLGTVFGSPSPANVPYGVSNTYGNLDSYGPFGVLLNPVDDKNKSSETNNRLAGGAEEEMGSTSKSDSASFKDPCIQQIRTIRQVINDDSCKKLLEGYDKVLNSYKKSLGPCGKPTCPLAQNILDCSKLCHGEFVGGVQNDCECDEINKPDTYEEFTPGDPACGQKACPFFNKEKTVMDNDFLTLPKAVDCGNRTCPFKGDNPLNTIDLQSIPPSYGSVYCGSPLCQVPKRKKEKELQPIHWECDEPLPQGPCTNPDCPIDKEARRQSVSSRSSTYSPGTSCGTSRSHSPNSNRRCYSPTPPPDCYTIPFCYTPQSEPSPAQCYFPPPPKCYSPPQPKTTNATSRPPSASAAPRCCGGGSICQLPPASCSAPPPPVCPYPTCPLNIPPKTCYVVLGPCGSFDCPYKPAAPPCCGDPNVEPCMDPSCPFTPIAKCGNPGCPFKEIPQDKPCPNPTCPSKPLPPSPCGNPSCPYTKMPVDDYCGSPVCPFKPPEPLLCGNPDYSYSETPADYICVNPKCPFKPPEISPCGNPDCPYLETPMDNFCGNPKCHFKPPDPSPCGIPECPYLDTPKDNFCGNPKCPFKPPESSPCGNPVCPYSETPKDNFCGNPKCPFKPPEPSPCGNPICPYQEIPKDYFCGNPACPFKPPTGDQSDTCGDPFCPFNQLSCHDPPVGPCGDPDCAFKPVPGPSCNDPNVEPCMDPSCPFTPKPICSNPRCPYNPSPPPCPLCASDNTCLELCGGPSCPFSKDPVCLSPRCPFSKEEDKISCYNQGPDPCTKTTCKWLNDYVKCGKCKGLSKSGATCDNPHPTQEVTPAAASSNEKNPVNTSDQKINANAPESSKTSGKVKKKGSAGLVTKAGKSNPEMKSSKDESKVEVPTTSTSDKGITGKDKTKKRSKFVYDCGDDYPGVKVGHRDCLARHGCTIPTNMGWLWNVRDQYGSLKPRGTGWRPGAMAKVISERIRKHRENHGCEMLNLFGKFVGKKSKKPLHASNSNISIPDKPTLQVKKKKGVYLITMNPLKDPHARKLEENESPYLDCTPMQFKIVKNKDKLTLLNGEEGEELYKNCMCGVDEDDDDDKSSESELEIEFTPPAGIIHPEMRKRKHSVVHTDTQYDPKDCVVPKKAEGKKKEKKEKGGKEKGKKGKGKEKGGKGKGGGKAAKGKKK